MLTKAIHIATTGHDGQFDKAGEPYILHPLRVMLSLHSEIDRICGVLHDLIEDTDWTLDGLRREGFSQEVLDALDCLTRRENENYDDFITRVCRNPTARRVKKADLMDNMNIARIASPTSTDFARVEKYRKALGRLM